MEFARGYIKLEADFQQAERNIKQMDDQFRKATENMQKAAEKTAESFEQINESMRQLEKISQQTGKTTGRSFAVAATAAGAFGKAVSVAFAVLGVAVKGALWIFRTFNRVLSSAFSGVITLIQQLINTFIHLGSAGGKAASLISAAFRQLIVITSAYIAVIREMIKMFAQLAVTAVHALRSVREWADNLTKSLVFVQLDIRYIISQMRNLSLALVGAIGAATTALASFEESFVRVRRVMDLTNQEFDVLQRNLRDMARDTTSSAAELADLTFIAGQLGIEGEESVAHFTRTMDMVQQTTRIAGEEGAAQFARLMRLMGENVDEMEHMASAVVGLGRNFAVFEDEILTMSVRLAGTATVLGISTSEVLALAAALSASAVRAELGGSAISRVMMEIAEAVDFGGESLTAFAEITGRTEKEFRELVRRAPIRAIQEFIEGLGRMSEEGDSVFRALERVGLGQIRTRDAVLRLAAAGGLLNETLAESADAYASGTAHIEEFEERMSTLWAQIQRFRSELLEAARIFAVPFLERAKDAVVIGRALARVFQNLEERQFEVIAGFLSVAGVFTTFITITLIAIRTVFTFATGLTLLVRAALFLLPWILMIRLVTRAFSRLENVEPQDLLFGIARAARALYATTRGLGKALLDTFQETQLYEDWSDAVSGAFEEVLQAVELYEEDELTEIELTLEMSISLVDMLANIAEAANEGLRQFRVWMREEDIQIFEDPMAAFDEFDPDAAVGEREWVHLAASITRLLLESFRLAFIEIPTTLHTALQQTGVYSSIISAGQTIGTHLLQGITDAMVTATEVLGDEETGVIAWIEALETPAFADIDLRAQIEGFAEIPEPYEDFLMATIDFLGVVRQLFAAAFSKIAEEISWAFEEYEVWDKLEENLVNALEWMTDQVDAFDEWLPDAFEGTAEVAENVEGPITTAFIDLFQSILSVYFTLLEQSIRFIIRVVPWKQIGADIASLLWQGFWGRLRIGSEGEEMTDSPVMKYDFFNVGNWMDAWNALVEWMMGLFPTREDIEEGYYGITDRIRAAFPVWMFGERPQYGELIIDPPPEVPWDIPSLRGVEERHVTALLAEMSRMLAVPEDLVIYLAQIESELDPFAIGEDAERGPLQVMEGTFEDMDKFFDGYDLHYDRVEHQMMAGVMYLKYLLLTQEEQLHAMVDFYDEIETLNEALITMYRWGPKGLVPTLQMDPLPLRDVLRIRQMREMEEAQGMRRGGILPGFGGGDRIPAMLEAGEAVVPARVVAGGMNSIIAWFSQFAPGFQGGFLSAAIGDDMITELEESIGIDIDVLEEYMEKALEYLDSFTAIMQLGIEAIIEAVKGLGELIIWALGDIIDEETEKRITGFFSRATDILESIAKVGEGMYGTLEDILLRDPVEEIEPPELEVFWDLEKLGLTHFKRVFDDLEDVVTLSISSFKGMRDAVRNFIRSSDEVSHLQDSFAAAGVTISRKGSRVALAFLQIADAASGAFYAVSSFNYALLNETGELARTLGTFRTALIESSDQLGPDAGWLELLTQGSLLEGFLAVLGEMLTETETFENFLSLVAGTFEMLYNILEPIAESLMPILEAQLQAVSYVLQVLFGILKPILDLLEVTVFPILIMFAEFVQSIVKGIVSFWNALMDILSALPFVDLRRYKIELQQATYATEELTKAFQEITRNIPAGFRVGRAVWEAGGPYVPETGIGEARDTMQRATPLPDIHLHFDGDMYGFDDFRRTVTDIAQEGLSWFNFLNTGNRESNSSRFINR